MWLKAIMTERYGDYTGSTDVTTEFSMQGILVVF